MDQGQLVHSYPFCWRSDTPLLYKAVPSWFVRVEEIKDRLLANNRQTSWVPAFVQEKRFHNWLENARDWAISRSRFWGTPLPIWVSEDFSEVVVIGSIAELEARTGEKVGRSFSVGVGEGIWAGLRWWHWSRCVGRTPGL